MKSKNYLQCLAGFAVLQFGSSCAAVCYVNGNATGKNDGSSWVNAFVHPQFALLTGCKEIWVAKGVYTPAGKGSDPTFSFDISPGTKMYGGFAGDESSVDQRLPSINQTVLSGDVDHNDTDTGDWMNRTPSNIKGRNSYHVVTMQPSTAVPITSDTVLDGFLVVGGFAAFGADSHEGGGFYCSSDDDATCSPVLSNLAFVGNGTGGDGGAIAFSNIIATPTITNSVFHNNFSFGGGGAIFIDSTDSVGSTLISGCTFTNNGADYDGGAIEAANVQLDIVNTTFFENLSDAGQGGAIDLFSNAPLAIKNATFAGNFAAKEGGAISNLQSGSLGSIVITNSIFWSNSTSLGSAADIYEPAPNFAFVASSVLEHDCPDALSVCLSVSTIDPKLSSPADHGGSTITLLPGAGGSAIDTGDDGSACPPFDQRGVARPQGAHCDIGAVEWQPSDDIIFRNGFQ
ncbi:MAG TPA: choice-of-anchor Q domain-containing protein [Rudaea sp.]|nr:choice-of-anchor Q domain-containing protein [Rudaea sp.]